MFVIPGPIRVTTEELFFLKSNNCKSTQFDIITIAICAVICNADSFEHIAEFGRAKYEWLKGFLELPHAIPSADTFGRVFSRIYPKEFKSGFMQWIQAISQITKGDVIAVDGKTLRRSHDKSNGKSAIIWEASKIMLKILPMPSEITGPWKIASIGC
jgi:hypothetical protein